MKNNTQQTNATHKAAFLLSSPNRQVVSSSSGSGAPNLYRKKHGLTSRQQHGRKENANPNALHGSEGTTSHHQATQSSAKHNKRSHQHQQQSSSSGEDLKAMFSQIQNRSQRQVDSFLSTVADSDDALNLSFSYPSSTSSSKGSSFARSSQHHSHHSGHSGTPNSGKKTLDRNPTNRQTNTASNRKQLYDRGVLPANSANNSSYIGDRIPHQASLQHLSHQGGKDERAIYQRKSGRISAAGERHSAQSGGLSGFSNIYVPRVSATNFLPQLQRQQLFEEMQYNCEAQESYMQRVQQASYRASALAPSHMAPQFSMPPLIGGIEEEPSITCLRALINYVPTLNKALGGAYSTSNLTNQPHQSEVSRSPKQQKVLERERLDSQLCKALLEKLSYGTASFSLTEPPGVPQTAMKRWSCFGLSLDVPNDQSATLIPQLESAIVDRIQVFQDYKPFYRRETLAAQLKQVLKIYCRYAQQIYIRVRWSTVDNQNVPIAYTTFRVITCDSDARNKVKPLCYQFVSV